MLVNCYYQVKQNLYLELVDSHSTNPAKDIIVGKSIEKAINGNGHMSRLDWAGVQVSVVLRQQVNIMENEALVVLDALK